MARPISRIDVTVEERIELQRRVRASTTPQRESMRARIILLRAKGRKEADVAKELSVSGNCVSKWSSRYEAFGLQGLTDKPGRGRRPSLPTAKIEQVLTKVTQPPKGRRRWSVRTMAKAAGISPDSVHRVWKQNDLKPHLTRTFKLSSDPQFETKFWDVIGLYLNPPDKALVLCCDEKSQLSGAGTYPAWIAVGNGPYPNPDARLLPAWDDYPLCSAELSGWQGHLPY